MRKVLILTLLVFAITSCTMAPKYEKPKAPVPLVKADSKTTKNHEWREFYLSPEMQSVIQIALDNNRNLKTAGLNIEIVRQTYNIKRADLMPSVNIVGSETRQGVPSAFASFTPKTLYRANISLSAFELDFFGKIRSLKNAAFETYLATKEARNIVRMSLIAETANSYVQLITDKEILKLSDEYLNEKEKKYNILKTRYENGRATRIDMNSAENEYENAKILRETYLRIVQQDKNALMLLLGIFDEKLLDDKLFDTKMIGDIKFNEKILYDTPSEILLSRPDIKQAERNLKSSNANIGAARAAFFPSITLTGSYGYSSRSLDGLSDSQSWSLTPQVNIPIFNAGRNLANLKIANSQKKIQIIKYEQAIQTAFKESLDELAIRKSISAQLESSRKIESVSKESYSIASVRFSNGNSDAVVLSDAKVQMLISQQNLKNKNREYMANLISLYKVFGGGCEESEGDVELDMTDK